MDWQGVRSGTVPHMADLATRQPARGPIFMRSKRFANAIFWIVATLPLGRLSLWLIRLTLRSMPHRIDGESGRRLG
jgi:hypothetical protein